jgi:hypothetical protein
MQYASPSFHHNRFNFTDSQNEVSDYCASQEALFWQIDITELLKRNCEVAHYLKPATQTVGIIAAGVTFRPSQ